MIFQVPVELKNSMSYVEIYHDPFREEFIKIGDSLDRI